MLAALYSCVVYAQAKLRLAALRQRGDLLGERTLLLRNGTMDRNLKLDLHPIYHFYAGSIAGTHPSAHPRHICNNTWGNTWKSVEQECSFVEWVVMYCRSNMHNAEE